MQTDVLNPSGNWTLGPDYGFQVGRPDNLAKFDARTGERYVRRISARGYAYQLSWLNRPLSTRIALEQWQNQFEHGYFSFYDAERARYYSGNFDSPLVFTPAGNDKWNITGVFTEIPGLPMYAYPSAWDTDAIMLKEADDFGNLLVKLTGSWNPTEPPLGLQGSAYWSSTTNDIAEWEYFGYGFRAWLLMGGGLGIVEVSLDDAVVGTADLYQTGALVSSAAWTQVNAGLGEHRVKLRVTGTKNSASAQPTIYVGAIQVMR